MHSQSRCRGERRAGSGKRERERESDYLRLGSALPVGIGLADEVKVFFVEFFLFAMLPPPLLLFAALALFFFLFLLLFFIFIYDETFSNLSDKTTRSVSQVCWWVGRAGVAYSSGFLLILVVFLLFAGIVDDLAVAIVALAGVVVKRLLILLFVQLGLPIDQVAHVVVAHCGRCLTRVGLTGIGADQGSAGRVDDDDDGRQGDGRIDATMKNGEVWKEEEDGEVGSRRQRVEGNFGAFAERRATGTRPEFGSSPDGDRESGPCLA
jgi:hypothetical protein